MNPTDQELIARLEAHGVDIAELFLIQGRVYLSKDAGDFLATSTYEPLESAPFGPENLLVSLLRRLDAPEYESAARLDDEIQLFKEWESLYAELAAVLERHGDQAPVGDEGFYLIGDCYSTAQHKVECASSGIFTPALVADVQSTLKRYSREWEVIFALPPAEGTAYHAYSVYSDICIEHRG